MSEILNLSSNYSVNSEDKANSGLSQISDNYTEIVAQETIRLLEERLVVDNKKYKVGEVIVRKVVETRMLQVPVRREKLIIEQLYPRYKKLGEVSLSETDITQEQIVDGKSHLQAEFNSPQAAIDFLNQFVESKPAYQTSKVQILIANPQV